ncbi:DUF427 domain-containing protein [Spiribacter vilamensis]|uniref:Uncharacterized protein (DUF427 family) n=1 Tax=Spiribacter vilamensis TaxID=531306 RepID=A0A4V2GJ88_9GAMM|nr:DUF427 domain-containing protein [Spiribacter vilamensis]RZU98935.1 uncharacterized protein (DUF427 family) [Spiribacter vilamensis]TVO62055.1 DUF427 domain-containing protein [Spiribacter vilamensis]
MSNDRDNQRQRDAWRYRGGDRPPFAVTPGSGEESVWDYPRPPAYKPDRRGVTVLVNGQRMARSDHAIRAMETGSPPAFYLPPEAVDVAFLRPSSHRTYCEWKGEAEYFDVVTDTDVIEAAVWRYPRPLPGAEAIAGWYSLYPEKLTAYVGDEPVQAQSGRYYGGWVTSELVGPWKGDPGTGHW